MFLHQQNHSPNINWTGGSNKLKYNFEINTLHACPGFGTTKFIWCPSEAQSTNSAMIEFYNDSYSSIYIHGFEAKPEKVDDDDTYKWVNDMAPASCLRVSLLSWLFSQKNIYLYIHAQTIPYSFALSLGFGGIGC